MLYFINTNPKAVCFRNDKKGMGLFKCCDKVYNLLFLSEDNMFAIFIGIYRS